MLLVTLVIPLVAQLVAAKPVLIDTSPVKLSMTRRTNFTNAHDLLLHDQRRAKFLKARGKARAAGLSIRDSFAINDPIENQAVSYLATIGIGNPPTTYSLIVDTGSSNTWVGADRPYKKTSTSIPTSQNVSVSYGLGSFNGTEYFDRLTIATQYVIPKQSIGAASASDGFDGVDGILGIGPVGLTLGTLSPESNTLIPTVTDNLFSNGIINANEIGISFEPTTKTNNTNGEITWGGTDPTKFNGPISYIPLTTTSPANNFWGIDQSIKYGSSTSILNTTAGIVDTGTTLILLATDAFNRYKTATKSQKDSDTGLLWLPASDFNRLQSLFFTAGKNAYELTPNAQIWPRALNTAIGGKSDRIYLIVGDLDENSGEGFDFVNGLTFLERFYSVYDTGNKRVGLATTPFTKATSN